MSLQYQAGLSGFVTLKRLRLLLWLGFCFLCIGNVSAQVLKEYDLKAVFLYNFAQFVEWPPEAFALPASPLVIGVLGQDHFGKSFDDLIQGETTSRRIASRTLQILGCRWRTSRRFVRGYGATVAV